ncbi:superoxide dismutase, partial [Nephila pilipes]
APLKMTGEIDGLSYGEHGMHVHELGDLSKGCKSLGGHFNPYGKKHGAPTDMSSHLGDLGNVMAGKKGVASVNIVDKHLSLYGEHSIIGRSIVVSRALFLIAIARNSTNKNCP